MLLGQEMFRHVCPVLLSFVYCPTFAHPKCPTSSRWLETHYWSLVSPIARSSSTSSRKSHSTLHRHEHSWSSCNVPSSSTVFRYHVKPAHVDLDIGKVASNVIDFGNIFPAGQLSHKEVGLGCLIEVMSANRSHTHILTCFVIPLRRSGLTFQTENFLIGYRASESLSEVARWKQLTRFAVQVKDAGLSLIEAGLVGAR